jgi:putative ABC transport system permease protein
VSNGHGAWKSLLRLAFRNLARHRVRTVLICVLIGLPVAAAVTADTLYLTHAPTSSALVRELMGTADARIVDTQTVRVTADITYRYNGWTSSGVEKPRAALTAGQIAALLPAGSSMARPCATSDDGGGTNGLATSGDSAVSVWTTVCVTGSAGEAQLRLETGRLATKADEVAVTTAVAERLGFMHLGRLRSGSTLRVDGGAAATVVGVADERTDTSAQALYVAAGSTVATTKPATTWLVTFPPAVRDDPVAISTAAAVLSESGLAGNFRDPILHPELYPDSGGSPDRTQLDALALGAVFVAFGLVEVVLLAGAAMSVGVRRQAREIGLLGAIGGDRRDIRRLVLTQTLAYSVTGAVLAVPVGLLGAVAARPIAERVANRDMCDLGLAPLHWLALAGFGVLGGLVAGWWPARGVAKLPTVDALTGRLGDPRMAVRVPVKRFVVAGLGIATSLAVGTWLFTAVRSFDTDQTSTVVVPMLALIAGLATTTLALAALMSPLLGLVGRRVGRLPLATRFAVRDLGRQRSRTAPAAAAVMVAVAAALGISFILAGTDAHERRIYQPWLPVGDMSLYAPDRAGSLDQVTAVAVAAVPGSRIVHVPTITSTVKHDETSEGYVPPLVAALPSRLQYVPEVGTSFELALGERDLLRHVLPDDADRILALLAQGRAVLLSDDPSITSVGLIRTPTDDSADAMSGRVTAAFDRTLPVTGMRPSSRSSLLSDGTVLISPSMLRDLRLRTETGITLVVPPGPIDAATVDEVRAKVEQRGGNLHAELGYVSRLPATMLIAAGIAAFLAIAATVISLALVQSEGRADLATLAAVGADPSRRRLITFWQALTIAVVGGVTGTMLGGFVAFASRPLAGYIAVPWLPVLLVTVVLPIVSAGLATAFTRSRLPMVRRLS